MKHNQYILKIYTLRVENQDGIIDNNLYTQIVNKTGIDGIVNYEGKEVRIRIPKDYSSERKVQLIFKKNQEVCNDYGSLSFDLEIFNHMPNGITHKWCRIYDKSQEHDMYEGDMETDEENKPRALIRFMIEEVRYDGDEEMNIKEKEEVMILEENKGMKGDSGQGNGLKDGQNLGVEKKFSSPLKGGNTYESCKGRCVDLDNQHHQHEHEYGTSSPSRILPPLTKVKSSSKAKILSKSKGLGIINRSSNINDDNKGISGSSSSGFYHSVSGGGTNMNHTNTNSIGMNISTSSSINRSNRSNSTGTYRNGVNNSGMKGSSMSRYDTQDTNNVMTKNEYASENGRSSMKGKFDQQGSRIESQNVGYIDKYEVNIDQHGAYMSNAFECLSKLDGQSECDSINTLRQDYENEITLFNAKLVEANELVKTAKHLREVILTTNKNFELNSRNHSVSRPSFISEENGRVRQSNLKGSNEEIEGLRPDIGMKLSTEKVEEKKKRKKSETFEEEAKIEIERQRMLIMKLEGMVGQLQEQFEITKNLYTTELNNKAKNAEKTQQLKAENERLQDELKILRMKYETDMYILKKEIDLTRIEEVNIVNGNGITYNIGGTDHDDLESLEVKQEISNKGILLDIIRSLKGELMKLKKEKNEDIYELNEKLKQVNGYRDQLERDLNILKKENEKLNKENTMIMMMNQQRNNGQYQNYQGEYDGQGLISGIEQQQQNRLLKGEENVKSDRKSSKMDYYTPFKVDKVEQNNKKTPNGEKNDIIEGNLKLLQQELVIKNKTIEDLKKVNTDLKIKRESSNDKKSLKDSSSHHHHLFEELRRQYRAIEAERDALKLELALTKENYIKLTNKYVDLTDTMAVNNSSLKSNCCSEMKKPSIRNSNTTTAIKTPNLICSTSPISKRTGSMEQGNMEKVIKGKENVRKNKDNQEMNANVDKSEYGHNAKKLNIKMLNGKPSIKIGTEFIPLVDFLKKNKNGNRMHLNISTSPIESNHDNEEKTFDMGLYNESPSDINKHHHHHHQTLIFSKNISNVLDSSITPSGKTTTRYYLKDGMDRICRTYEDEQASKSNLDSTKSAILGGGSGGGSAVSRTNSGVHAKENDPKQVKSLLKKTNNMTITKSVDKKNPLQSIVNTPYNGYSSSTVNTSTNKQFKSFRDISPINAKKTLGL